MHEVLPSLLSSKYHSLNVMQPWSDAVNSRIDYRIRRNGFRSMRNGYLWSGIFYKITFMDC